MLESNESLRDLLATLAAGDESAAQRLFPLVYDELHRLADSFMRQERTDHTLQPTALIHEAFLRLASQPTDDSLPYENIGHFIATAAVVMRRILVNHAKAKKTEKRGGDRNRIQVEDISAEFQHRSIDLIALDEALERLTTIDPIQSRLVELRFFGGMTVDQCAEVLNLSSRSVYYEWAHARAWLRDQLEAAS